MHQEVGKLLIAAEILSKENRLYVPEKNWYDYIVHELISCDMPENILDNNLSVVTFNYSVAFEYYLYDQLTKNPRFSSVADEYFEKLQNNLVHVYGSVRGGTFNEIHRCYGTAFGRPQEEKFKWTRLLNEAASSKIKVIYEDKRKDVEDQSHIIKAKKLIQDAKRNFILGFGFDEQNTQLLGLRDLENKEVLYTKQDNRSDFELIVKNSFRRRCKFRGYSEIGDALATIGLSPMRVPHIASGLHEHLIS